jgi:MYXO-CTERM domain-containing protein
MSARGSTLYVVADNVVDGYAVGTSADEGQTWQPLMSYDQIAAIQGCVHAVCQTDCMARAAAGQFSDDFCAATAPASPDGGPPSDAGPPGNDAGHDAAPTDAGGSDAAVSPPSSGCSSCRVASGDASRALPLALALAIVAGLRRRRRARPGNHR